MINGKYYAVPMCIEEPSVIAACSSSAKFIAENGNGFQTLSTRGIMIGQMQVLDCVSTNCKFLIEKLKEEIIEKSNQLLTNMVQRGGGVVDVKAKILEENMIIVEFFVNVCESMGANIVNSLLEGMSPYIQTITGGRIGIRILSNLCTERRALAEFCIPVHKMKWKETKVKK